MPRIKKFNACTSYDHKHSLVEIRAKQNRAVGIRCRVNPSGSCEYGSESGRTRESAGGALWLHLCLGGSHFPRGSRFNVRTAQ